MKKVSEKPLLVIDLETSGVNPFVHEVLSVGLVPFNADLPSANVFVRHSEVEWSPYAKTNFQKFETEWTASAVPPKEACEYIEDYLRATFGDVPVTAIGHNIGFDIAFLRKLAFQGGRSELAGLSHRAIDTHTLLYVLAALGRIPDSSVNSSAAFKQFEISVPEDERHTALGDAKATRDLLRRILQLFE